MKNRERVKIASLPEPVALDWKRTALIIIDMQNDFLHPEGWFPSAGIDATKLLTIVPVIDSLATDLRRVDAKIVWLNWGVTPNAPELPARIRSKASNAGRRPTYGDTHPTGRGHVLGEGEWGAQIVSELTPDKNDLFVTKRRFSGFHDSTLDTVLRNHDIDTLLFAGVNTDRCVYGTLCDAAARGYNCVLLEDACATGSSDEVRDSILYLVKLLHGVCATRETIRHALHT